VALMRDRLGAVLRVRRIQEDVERARVAAAAAEEARAAADVATRTERVRTGPTDRTLVELAWLALDRARLDRATHASVLEARRAEWAVAAQRVKGLERLVDRRAEELRREEARKSLALADDLVAARGAGR
jgi:hypothetical protein